MQLLSDTIVGISTAVSNAGIGVIRVSGEDAITICDKVYRGAQPLVEVESHRVCYGHIVEADEVIDEVMVLVLKAPHTYTREDTVEIDCHGGTQVLRKILRTVVEAGARLAEPGEFTKRAFLNGRIDLSQAESVMDLINSKNEFSRKNALSQLNGAVSSKVRDYRGIILERIAYIEAALDDPEHMSLEGFGDSLLADVDNLLVSIDRLIASSDNGSVLKNGIKTLIVGRPNVGKSSILNLLAQNDRAIVTDIPGTTRDVLLEEISLDGITLQLIDTAGIRATDDVVEKIGVEKALSCIDEADLILFVVDSSAELDENDGWIFEQVKEKNPIILLNKTDLSGVVTSDDIRCFSGYDDEVIISFSANSSSDASGECVQALSKEIAQRFYNNDISLEDDIYITNERHKRALLAAKDSLLHVRESIANAMPEDFLSIDLMDAYEQLGFIIGESVEDDLVNEIFSKFCMGK